tara:strand:- start:448 stop:672 length:225 start_codon:yes stop_codon:yes gene_type:complete
MDLYDINKPQLDVSKATDFECEKCQSKIFDSKFMIKSLSALVSPTGQEIVIPIQVFSCDGCGHVDDKFSSGDFE